MDLMSTAQLLGNFGEFFGAIAVVVTLVYLAGQLRQNTKALRSASYEHWNEVSSSFTDFYAQYAAVLCEIQTHTSLDQLTPPERIVFTATAVKTIDQAQTAFLHHRAGTLDDDVFESRLNSFNAFYENDPLMRQLWSSSLRDYPTVAFRKFVEKKFTSFKAVDS